MREALGDGYAQALRAAWPEVPESADFVMYWWHQAAETVRAGLTRRFGLITTNSVTMIFNRRVVEAHLRAAVPLRMAFAIPDHPWVDSADGAAVRIAMTVGTTENTLGLLLRSVEEREAGHGEVAVRFESRPGLIHADLMVGANVAGAVRLRSNDGVSNRGVIPHGAGFIVTRGEAAALGLGTVPGLERHIREYRNGRDLTDRPRDVLVIDTIGLTANDLRRQFPAVFQWLIERVKPERDLVRRKSIRDNWWLHAWSRNTFRPALDSIPRFIATGQVAKHRVFQFLSASVLPDDKLIAIATKDALHLGVLSAAVHVQWALASGGRLGVGNDPVYSKSTCFESFPFPSDDTGLTPDLADRIRSLAEHLDAHRKARQAAHESVTLTGLYNVLDKLRRGESLSAGDKALHEQGLVSVLRTLHDELDAAVLQAYGWSDLGPVPGTDDAARSAWTECLLERLVALNARRAAEEASGTIRWLRPEFQNPAHAAAAAEATPEQSSIDLPDEAEQAEATSAKPAAARLPWPAALPEQMRAVADVLSAAAHAQDEAALAERFTGRGAWKKRLPQILQTLEALGRARREGDRWRA